MVLFKQFLDEKIVFFTNYQSKKGDDITSNENISVVFFGISWKANSNSRISKKTSRSVSETYFNSRPIGSRVSAILSQQSKKLKVMRLSVIDLMK